MTILTPAIVKEYTVDWITPSSKEFVHNNTNQHTIDWIIPSSKEFVHSSNNEHTIDWIVSSSKGKQLIVSMHNNSH